MTWRGQAVSYIVLYREGLAEKRRDIHGITTFSFLQDKVISFARVRGVGEILVDIRSLPLRNPLALSHHGRRSAPLYLLHMDMGHLDKSTQSGCKSFCSCVVSTPVRSRLAFDMDPRSGCTVDTFRLPHAIIYSSPRHTSLLPGRSTIPDSSAVEPSPLGQYMCSDQGLQSDTDVCCQSQSHLKSVAVICTWRAVSTVLCFPMAFSSQL